MHVQIEPSISIFWAVACHVALETAPETVPFFGQLGSLFWGKLFEIRLGVYGIDFHQNYS